MSGPASTITITIEALTEQANAKLTSFLAGLDAKLNSALKNAAVAQEKFFITPTNPGLKKILDDISSGADKASKSIGGMSYYFRSAIDGIRLAFAGGGARAGFYALDEAVRGLVSSGGKMRGMLVGAALELAEMVPLVGTAALGWIALDEILSKPTPLAQYLAKQNNALKEQAGWLQIVQKLHAAGAITGSQAARDSGFNMGSVNDLMERGLVMGSKDGAKATQTGQAFMDISDVLAELRKGGLDETGKKLDEIDAKFRNLKNAAEVAGKTLVDSGKMSQAAYDALVNSIDAAHEHESNSAVDAANFKNRQESQQKAQEAFAKGQEMFAAMVRKENADLERDLNLSAAQQGKTREDIYAEEYKKRIELLEGQLYAGEIGEKEYTDAVTDASIKRLEGLRREHEEQMRMQVEQDRELKEKARDAAEETLRDPDASQGDKEKAIQSLIDLDRLMLDQNQTAIELADTDRERNELIRERLRLEHQYSEDQRQQSQMERLMNDARVTGVRNMFGNMATAAKSFGKEGVAAYKGFAIAQATIDTAKAAIAAYSSVVGIPYVGPILAPIAAAAAVAAGAAQIGAIESASGGYREGGFTGSGNPNEVAGVVHRGEFVIPAERVGQFGLGFFQALHSGRFSAASVSDLSRGGDSQPGPGGSVIQHKTELSLATFGGEADAKRWAEGQDGETWFLNQMDKHAYKYQRQS